MKWDEKGLQLADVPNAGASRADPNARSGNPLHDVRSGKFGSGGGGPKSKPRQPAAPAQVDAAQYARMFDAIREAARSIEDPQEEAIAAFIDGRAASPSQVDIQQFLQQVLEQRKADLVDLLDQAMRSNPLGKRRKVRIQAPRGYVRKLVGQLDSDGLAEVMNRLEAMGHDSADVDRFFDGRHEDVEQARQKRDTIRGS